MKTICEHYIQMIRRQFSTLKLLHTFPIVLVLIVFFSSKKNSLKNLDMPWLYIGLLLYTFLTYLGLYSFKRSPYKELKNPVITILLSAIFVLFISYIQPPFIKVGDYEFHLLSEFEKAESKSSNIIKTQEENIKHLSESLSKARIDSAELERKLSKTNSLEKKCRPWPEKIKINFVDTNKTLQNTLIGLKQKYQQIKNGNFDKIETDLPAAKPTIDKLNIKLRDREKSSIESEITILKYFIQTNESILANDLYCGEKPASEAEHLTWKYNSIIEN